MGFGLQIPPPRVAANLSSSANSILGIAVAHQESASESRIGVQVRKGSTKPNTGGLPRFKALQKPETSTKRGTSILAERREKKADWTQQQSITGPKFVVMLWKSPGVEEKPKQVCLSLLPLVPPGLTFT